MIRIYVYYGKDDFTRREAYLALRASIETEMGPPDTMLVDGREARVEEVLLACRTVPFLGSGRLIVIEGLLSRFDDASGRRGRRRRDGAALGGWGALVEEAASLPDSTVVVFLDGEVRRGNPLLEALTHIASEVRDFRPPQRPALPRWIAQRAAQVGVDMDPRAVQTLASIVGPNLWALATEIDKLATYSDGAQVTAEDVDAVGPGREANLFAMVDAVVEGRRQEAMATLRQLLDAGEPPQRILALIVRQYRNMVLLRDTGGSGTGPASAAAQLDLPEFALRRLQQQASRYTIGRLRAAYQCLLDADLGIKRGLRDEETSLLLLVQDLCALSETSGPPAKGRQWGRAGRN